MPKAGGEPAVSMHLVGPGGESPELRFPAYSRAVYRALAALRETRATQEAMLEGEEREQFIHALELLEQAHFVERHIAAQLRPRRE